MNAVSRPHERTLQHPTLRRVTVLDILTTSAAGSEFLQPGLGDSQRQDSIGSHQKEERPWSERYVTFGEDRSTAFLVATSPSILLPKKR
jgi:hypothetical protein